MGWGLIPNHFIWVFDRFQCYLKYREKRQFHVVTVLLAFCYCLFLITLPQAVKLLLSKQNLCPVLLISISKYQNKTNIFFSHNLGSRKKRRQRYLSEDTVTFAVHSLYRSQGVKKQCPSVQTGASL